VKETWKVVPTNAGSTTDPLAGTGTVTPNQFVKSR
jgi:hypothetical protein